MPSAPSNYSGPFPREVDRESPTAPDAPRPITDSDDPEEQREKESSPLIPACVDGRALTELDAAAEFRLASPRGTPVPGESEFDATIAPSQYHMGDEASA